MHMWWLFVAAMFVVSGTPGPNMLHIMARSVALGWRRTMVAMAGCLVGLVLLQLASAAGLAGLLLAVPRAFEALRWAGAGYLVWLGIKAWRADAGVIDTAAPAQARMGAGELFRTGMAVSLSNPKAIIFSAAFLPQFIEPAAPHLPQLALLVATAMAIETLWYFGYALGGARLARHLAVPALRRGFNRATGALFVGFGLVLLQAKLR